LPLPQQSQVDFVPNLHSFLAQQTLGLTAICYDNFALETMLWKGTLQETSQTRVLHGGHVAPRKESMIDFVMSLHAIVSIAFIQSLISEKMLGDRCYCGLKGEVNSLAIEKAEWTGYLCT
jgi:hypothetical protein